jgi:nitronate monooxygenase
MQTLKDAIHAIEVSADIIVAQGTEAGGHGEKRATFTLVPEVADYIAAKSPDVLLCAAGGIGDGRGLDSDARLKERSFAGWCMNDSEVPFAAVRH